MIVICVTVLPGPLIWISNQTNILLQYKVHFLFFSAGVNLNSRLLLLLIKSAPNRAGESTLLYMNLVMQLFVHVHVNFHQRARYIIEDNFINSYKIEDNCY